VSRRHIAVLAAAFCIVWGAVTGRIGRCEKPAENFRSDIPKVWDEAALADWATPIAGLNVRPTHISERPRQRNLWVTGALEWRPEVGSRGWRTPDSAVSAFCCS
jgi:hypothetical protein